MRRTTFSFLLALLSSFTFLAAQPGNALSFDGTNDNVTAALPPLFGNIAANDFTMEAWVYPTGAIFSRIIYAQSSTTNFATMSTGASNQIYFYVIANGTTYSVATTAFLPSNTWTHVAARWTAATLTPVVFFNGVQQATAAGGGSSTGTLNNLSIGTRPGGAQYFPGSLDEVRIWSTARSQCAILANMNRTYTGPQTNLVAYYTFDQGTAGGTNTGQTSLTDLSGNAYTGTLNNFALTGATSNWITSAAAITSSGNDAANTYQTAVSANVCSGGSYTFPDSSTQTNITTPLVQTSNLVTSLGCDSIVTTTLGVLPSSNDSTTARICFGDSYLYPDGSIDTNITASLVHTSILTNSVGCDSVIVTAVEVGTQYTFFAFDTVCLGSTYTFLDGSSSPILGQVNHANNYTSIYGCDSVIVQIVDAHVLDTAVTVNGFTLTATASASSYQWIDCATGLPVTGGNTQIYTPTLNGNYAVVLSNAQGCTDTSACTFVLVIGRPDASLPQLLAYPNPNSGSFRLRLPAGSPLPTDIEVFNAVGQRVYLGQATTIDHQVQLADAPAGVYTLRAHLPEGTQSLRLVVLR